MWVDVFIWSLFWIPAARGRWGADHFMTKFGKLGKNACMHWHSTPCTHPLTPTRSHTHRLTDVNLHEMYVFDDADVMIAGIGFAGIVWMYHKWCMWQYVLMRCVCADDGVDDQQCSNRVLPGLCGLHHQWCIMPPWDACCYRWWCWWSTTQESDSESVEGWMK